MNVPQPRVLYILEEAEPERVRQVIIDTIKGMNLHPDTAPDRQLGERMVHVSDRRPELVVCHNLKIAKVFLKHEFPVLLITTVGSERTSSDGHLHVINSPFTPRAIHSEIRHILLERRVVAR